MSLGEMAYERARRESRLDRAWVDLSADERATWEAGAALPAVIGIANIVEGRDRQTQ